VNTRDYILGALSMAAVAVVYVINELKKENQDIRTSLNQHYMNHIYTNNVMLGQLSQGLLDDGGNGESKEDWPTELEDTDDDNNIH